MNNIILLVEDNQDDAQLAIRALQKSKLANEIVHVEDGQEALDYLNNPDNPVPRLILLDLKMPRVNGLEVIQVLKQDKDKKVIPIVMMTSSNEEPDVLRAYELGVNSYIVKPVDFRQFADAVGQVGMFWLVLNQPSPK
jgi:two-component system, response regulator